MRKKYTEFSLLERIRKDMAVKVNQVIIKKLEKGLLK